VCRYVGINYQGGCSFGHSLTGCTVDSTTSEGSLVDAERLRRTLEALASHHESEATKLVEVTNERR
jgi:hypothetical protein